MKNKILKFVKSTYGIIIILFIFWMIFFDSNSLIIHSELNNDIKELNEQKTYYEKEIAKDNHLEIITTEKDYKRLNDRNKKSIKYLKIKLKIKNLHKFSKFLEERL